MAENIGTPNPRGVILAQQAGEIILAAYGGYLPPEKQDPNLAQDLTEVYDDQQDFIEDVVRAGITE